MNKWTTVKKVIDWYEGKTKCLEVYEDDKHD